jgi:lipid-A-disaccharide synthase-like uncharacterized protein
VIAAISLTWVLDNVRWFLSELQQPLVVFGFAAQFVFFMRFAVQWLVSERRGQSTIPISFWYLSIVGGLMTLVYALLRKDPVFMTSQSLSLFIYVRNLMLIYRHRASQRVVDVVLSDQPPTAPR